MPVSKSSAYPCAGPSSSPSTGSFSTNHLLGGIVADPDGKINPRGYTDARTAVAANDLLIEDNYGLYFSLPGLQLPIEYARYVKNLAASTDIPATQGVTVVVGAEYMVSIAGANASTAVLSGAGTGTLTNDGTNRQALNSPITATTTTLTITISGAVTNLLVEDVTGKSNQNPSEYVSSSDNGGLATYLTENANTVSSNVVTEAVGGLLGIEYNEELVTNGTFDSDTSGWGVDNDADLSVDTNRLKVLGTGTTFPNGYQVITTVVNQVYKVVANFDRDSSATTAYLNVGTTVAGAEIDQASSTDASGTISVTFTATTTTTHISVFGGPGSTTYCFWDNISVKEYETPAPSLMHMPGATNSLPDSYDLTTWTQTGTAVSALDATGLTGAPNTATTLTDDGAGHEYVSDTLVVGNDSNSHTFELWVEKDAVSSRQVEIALRLSVGTEQNIFYTFETDTGTDLLRASIGTASAELVDRGDWWQALVDVANNSTGNITLTHTVYPARSSVLGTPNSAATGSMRSSPRIPAPQLHHRRR
jgi:hypothetical protein